MCSKAVDAQTSCRMKTSLSCPPAASQCLKWTHCWEYKMKFPLNSLKYHRTQFPNVFCWQAIFRGHFWPLYKLAMFLFLFSRWTLLSSLPTCSFCSHQVSAIRCGLTLLLSQAAPLFLAQGRRLCFPVLRDDMLLWPATEPWAWTREFSFHRVGAPASFPWFLTSVRWGFYLILRF